MRHIQNYCDEHERQLQFSVKHGRYFKDFRNCPVDLWIQSSFLGDAKQLSDDTQNNNLEIPLCFNILQIEFSFLKHASILSTQ